ncbi:fibronectin type III domain-containing protein 7 [Erinaceus europaeus]|uniref:Fibronectin type III domain-containing protein 7 n=1 Tax=Erinaceus europaeus TaxID=9365 RepID=A0A1S3A3L0_ERIEU|nr:fibronectin type III domain-containing protein 7 [Erinaceus europaeus]
MGVDTCMGGLSAESPGALSHRSAPHKRGGATSQRLFPASQSHIPATASAAHLVTKEDPGDFDGIVADLTVRKWFMQILFVLKDSSLSVEKWLFQQKQVIPEAPEIPTIDQAYSKISNSITVEWATVPGATSYLLTAEDGDTVIETIVASSPGTVMGLKAATLYQITVRSISATGRSQASPPKQAKTVLAAPILQVSSPSPSSILVQWEVVYMAIGFSVSIMRANGLGRIWKENTTNTSLTFTSLEPGTLYTIKAYAWNANGTPGDDSTRSQRTSPCPPDNIRVSFNGGALEASVSWAPVEGAFNYTILAWSDSSELSCSTTFSSCTISSLQCGMEYLISVLASNDAGSSKSASGVTLKTVACAPAKVTIQEDPPGHLSVAWSNVDLGDYYVAFVKSDDGLEVHCNTSLTQCSFLSECGFTYFISVFAYNKAGQSPLGDVFNYTTAPCCPSDINPVVVSSDRVEIVWSPVRGAELYETKAVDGFNVVQCNDTAPACTLSALECDTKYNITVYSFSEVRGSNMSCTSRFITTAPCSPEIKNVSKDAFSMVNVHWQSSNDDATYTVTAQGERGLYRCRSTGESCTMGGLPCGALFSVNAVAETQAGRSLPSYSVPLETVPCCPTGLTVTQVTQSVINVSWTVGTGTQTYVTVLDTHIGQSKCHTHQNYCLLGCIMCGVNYTVALKAVSASGLTTDCAYHSYSFSACCPLGVKLYRLGPNGIRIHWQASRGSANYSTDLYGSKGIFTCVPGAGLSFCDVAEIPCGDVYTVMVSPVTESGLKLTFCPKKIYSVTCSGSTLGMGHPPSPRSYPMLTSIGRS